MMKMKNDAEDKEYKDDKADEEGAHLVKFTSEKKHSRTHKFFQLENTLRENENVVFKKECNTIL